MGSPQSGATTELSRAGRAGSDALRINLFSFEQYTASDSFSGLELVQQWESQIGSDDWCIHLPDSRLSKDKDKDTNIAKKQRSYQMIGGSILLIPGFSVLLLLLPEKN